MFFKQESGTQPVRDWLLEMDNDARKAIGGDMEVIEHRWPIGMPTCRAMGAGLWEVRTNLKNTIARVLFYTTKDEMILLHGFIKKTGSTPKADLDLAKERMKEHKKNAKS